MDRYFGLTQHGTTVRTEIMAGVTTFLTMAYIIFVNPQILSAAGMDRGAVFVATCVAAAFGTLVMGLYAKLPVAQAPGMGLNAYFTYGVVLGMGNTWQVALGCVFLSGIIFIIISVLPIREAVVNAIPRSLKMAISAGIGFFLAIIALENSKIIVAHQATLVTLGDVKQWTVILTMIGFVAIAALTWLRVTGAAIIVILALTVFGMIIGQVQAPSAIVSAPPSLAPTFLQMDLAGAAAVGLVAIVFAFLFVDLFDTAGTLVGVTHRAGLIGPDGKIPNLRQALLADSSATVVGAALGTSSVTSYIESAAGVNAGGRTGLTAVTVGVLFLASLILAPLALSIPAFATAPALLFVACLMARGLTEVDWEDVTEFAPAVVTVVAMPLTYSIAHGIAAGFITYAAIKILSGRLADAKPAVLILAALFILKFALL
jgi:AGZA family xanthine/uracil permease-like MFS transporter